MNSDIRAKTKSLANDYDLGPNCFSYFSASFWEICQLFIKRPKMDFFTVLYVNGMFTKRMYSSLFLS